MALNVASCSHIFEDIYGDLSFEDQFSEVIVLHSDDGVYNYYLLCGQCKPRSLEHLYVTIYPELGHVPFGHPDVFSDTTNYLPTKELTHLNLSQLDRESSIKDDPQIGSIIHRCSHVGRPEHLDEVISVNISLID